MATAIQGFQWPNIEFQAALKTTQISGNLLNFVKISGYLKSLLNSIKLSKLTKLQAMVIKDGGALFILYYTTYNSNSYNHKNV